MALTKRQTELVMALASADMRITDVSCAMGVHRNTVLYRIEQIENATGLNPRSFFDLCKLVKMATKTEIDEKEQNTMNKNLFRAKTDNHGVWVTGDLTHDYYKTGDTCVVCEGDIYPVDPETVGQFTALPHHDCIFEGDVLQHDAEKIRGVVIYSEADAAFVLKATDGQLYDFVDLPAHELTLMGNVHDNPELMEV